MLTLRELTGRADSHVRNVPELGCAVHAEAAAALLAMQAAAHAEGIGLRVASGFRDFQRQVLIWNAKYTGQRPLLDRHGYPLVHAELDERSLVDAILLWSALPGASRHHWGSEVDVFDQNACPAGYSPRLTPDEYAPGGVFERLDAWLTANMRRFGFFRPYVTDRDGVMPEPWHLSYAPISLPALDALTVEVLAEAVASSSMLGREHVLARLPELYERFIRAVDFPE